MLHILLIILKIIGIILAVILGILVLLVCVVLFVPVRYTAASECDGNPEHIKADVKVTWFLHLVKAVVHYEDKKPVIQVRIAWKKIGERRDEDEKREKPHEAGRQYVEEKQTEKKDEKSAPQPESSEEAVKEEPVLSERPEKKREESPPEPEKPSIFEKIKAKIERLKCTFQKFCDKIKLLLQRKDKLADFIQDEIHKNALSRLKKEVFKLLRRLKPKKLKASVQYGFEDPCTTGQVLAGLSMLYPLWGRHAQIIPDFEKQILCGNIYIKGRVYVLHLIALAWNMFWCRDVRQTYKDIRNFKF